MCGGCIVLRLWSSLTRMLESATRHFPRKLNEKVNVTVCLSDLRELPSFISFKYELLKSSPSSSSHVNRRPAPCGTLVPRDVIEMSLRLLQTLLEESRRLGGTLKMLLASEPSPNASEGGLNTSTGGWRFEVVVDTTSLRVGRRERRLASIMVSANVPPDKFVEKFVIARAKAVNWQEMPANRDIKGKKKFKKITFRSGMSSLQSPTNSKQI